MRKSLYIGLCILLISDFNIIESMCEDILPDRNYYENKRFQTESTGPSSNSNINDIIVWCFCDIMM